MRRSGFTVILIVLLIAGLAAAGLTAAEEGVTVRSDSLQIQEKTGNIRFQGGVEVRMGEMMLSCDLLVVHTDEADPSRIMSGEGSGNIVMIRGSDRVESQEAAFDLEAGIVELSGGPRLIREKTTIQADRIIYSLDKGTVSFHGPVRALFKAQED